MKTKTTYNIDQIVSITLVDKEEVSIYRMNRSLFQKIKVYKGKIDKESNEYFKSQGYIVEDGNVYHKPYIIVTYSNGKSCNMPYDTIELAEKKYSELCRTINKIIQL